MRFPSEPEKTEELILTAINAGINYFDTAYIYKGSEEALGHVLHKNDLRKKVNIATKLPVFMCRKFDDFERIFNKQLSRLKTDYIDYYLMHMLNNPDQWKQLREAGIEDWLHEKQSQGKIKNIGFSYHGKQTDFNDLVDIYKWDFCMIQYNYLDINHQAGLQGLQYAHSKNIPVMIMEPLRGGLLVNSPTKITQSPADLALRWVWNHSEVTLLLSGMANMEQLQENIESANEPYITDEEQQVVESLTSAYKAQNRIPCTACGYCMPCPVGVNIPGCFSAYNSFYAIKKSYSKYILETGAIISPKGRASDCINCSKCEPLCPQSIPIQAELKKVAKRMEPLWFKLGIPLARKFMTKKKKRGG